MAEKAMNNISPWARGGFKAISISKMFFRALKVKFAYFIFGKKKVRKDDENFEITNTDVRTRSGMVIDQYS